MENLVLFCKTYMGDLERLKILKESIDKFNADKLPVYLVMPKSDIEIIRKEIMIGSEQYALHFISDEEILSIHDAHEQNWYSQQVIKLSFWKTGKCKHYLSLDSDCIFIRNFYEKDYLYDENTPYLPLTEPMKGAECNFMQLFRFAADKNEEQNWNNISKTYLGRDGKRFCLNVPPVMSTEVLKHMEENFLKKNKLTFKNLIEINPYEYEWYCDYLLKYKPINYVVCTPFFLSFYTESLYLIYRLLGFDEKILSQYYTGIILHEGYIRDKKYRSSFLGRIIRRLILVHYLQNKDRMKKEKKFSRRIKTFIKKYIKMPFRVLFLGKSK